MGEEEVPGFISPQKYQFNNHPCTKMPPWKLQNLGEVSAPWGSTEMRKLCIERGEINSIALPSPIASTAQLDEGE